MATKDFLTPDTATKVGAVVARSHSNFSSAVIACLRMGGSPQPDEIDAVAARIWREARPDETPWCELVPGSPARRRFIRAAKMAVRVVFESGAMSKEPGRKKKRRNRLGLRWS